MKRLLKRRSRETADPEAALIELVGKAELPVFPGTVLRAVQQLSDPELDLVTVADVLAADPGITVRLLQLANSPAFSPRSPVMTVHQAVVLMGRNQLESMLIATGTRDALPSTPVPGFEPTTFWEIAAERATIAAALADAVDPRRKSEHFTSALLQDMAQPLLLSANAAYVDVARKWGDVHQDLAEHEQEELGWTHGEVGQLLCQHWHFPDALAQAISHHHDPLDTLDDLFGVVQWLAMLNERAAAHADLEAAAVRIGVEPGSLVTLIEEAREASNEVGSALA